MKFVIPALFTLFTAPALAVVLEEAPGTMPITPVLPQRSFGPEATAEAVKQLNAERQSQQPPPSNGGGERGRPGLRSGRPFASHERPDLTNAEAAGVQPKKARPASRPAKKAAKAKPPAKGAKPVKKKKK